MQNIKYQNHVAFIINNLKNIYLLQIEKNNEFTRSIIIIMSCQIPESPPEDQKFRPYICPCGKSYLSYPALFTHVKQKHDGKAPGAIVRPKSQNKRGRPRKSQGFEVEGEGSHERPKYKSFACRVLFNNEEERELGFLINQVESAKQRLRATKEFVPPISKSHLQLILAPQTVYPPHHNNSQSQQSPQGLIRRKLKELFQPLNDNAGYSGPTELEMLIRLNKPYLRALEQQRKSSRRPVGYNLWEMELRTALLVFLDSFKDSLKRNEFRNIEIVVALLVYFYYQQIGEATTITYVQHLNTFAGKFVPQLLKNSHYRSVFSLEPQKLALTLTIIHQWLSEQGLTDYSVELNDKCVRPQEQASEIQPQYNQQ